LSVRIRSLAIDGGSPLIFIVIGAVVIALMVFGHIAAKKRREALQALANQRNLTFDSSKHRNFDANFPMFECLSKGSRRYAENVLNGQWGERRFTGFDYHYETYSRNSKGRRQTHHHRFSAVILEAGLPLKELFIRPEGIFDKVTEFFGYDDIDFESAEFSKKFYVKAQDKRWAYDVIHQDTMQFLLGRPKFTIQFDLGLVIAFRSSKFDPQEFESAAETIEGMLDRLPGFVVEQQKANL
jgi:hypothetical protein